MTRRSRPPSPTSTATASPTSSVVESRKTTDVVVLQGLGGGFFDDNDSLDIPDRRRPDPRVRRQVRRRPGPGPRRARLRIQRLDVLLGFYGRHRETPVHPDRRNGPDRRRDGSGRQRLQRPVHRPRGHDVDRRIRRRPARLGADRYPVPGLVGRADRPGHIERRLGQPRTLRQRPGARPGDPHHDHAGLGDVEPGHGGWQFFRAIGLVPGSGIEGRRIRGVRRTVIRPGVLERARRKGRRPCSRGLPPSARPAHRVRPRSPWPTSSRPSSRSSAPPSARPPSSTISSRWRRCRSPTSWRWITAPWRRSRYCWSSRGHRARVRPATARRRPRKPGTCPERPLHSS